MSYLEDNLLKTSIINEVQEIIVSTNKIKQEINASDEFFKRLPESNIDILRNKSFFEDDPLGQISDIKRNLIRIRGSGITLKRLIESIKLTDLNTLEKDEMNHQLNDIITTLNTIKEKQSRLNLNTINSLTNLDEIQIIASENSTHISKTFANKIRTICMHNNDIYSSLKYVYEMLRTLRQSLERQQTNLSEKNNLNYIDKFKEDTDLIIKKYENEIKNLTDKFENQYKRFELNQSKVIKSSELLSDGVDAGLKSLADLNERTQNIELEFSKILGTETEKVKTDLNTSRIALNSVIDTITTEANTKLNEINTAHADFKNIVEQAGIYELTKNYKDKADEEKIEYKDFRKYTAWSIMAAIGSTLLIFLIAFLEHFFSAGNEPTNYLLLASRLSISVMFFVLAFYLSKQAAKHYECYQENHRTFLQLAALEPFMARMTPDEQKEIRKGLIPSYFNQSADGKFAAKGDEVDLPTSMHAIVNRLIDVVAEKKEPKPAETPAAEIKP